jgi:hypothetical protein
LDARSDAMLGHVRHQTRHDHHRNICPASHHTLQSAITNYSSLHAKHRPVVA